MIYHFSSEPSPGHLQIETVFAMKRVWQCLMSYHVWIHNFMENPTICWRTKPLTRGYNHIINPLVEGGVPTHIHSPPPGGPPHIYMPLMFRGLNPVPPFFPVVQFLGLKYSVLGVSVQFSRSIVWFTAKLQSMTKVKKCNNCGHIAYSFRWRISSPVDRALPALQIKNSSWYGESLAVLRQGASQKHLHSMENDMSQHQTLNLK